MPSLSWAQVRSRRLARHGLAAPLPGGPDAAVGAVVAAHAQVMSAAELAVGLRVDGCTRTHVRAALWDDRTLVKNYGPRGTVHLIRTVDLPLWTGALPSLPPGPPSALPEDVALSSDQVDAVVAAVGDALADAELTVDELTEALGDALGEWASERVYPAWHDERWPRWRQAIATASARGALCFGPLRGRTVTYTHPRRWLPGFDPLPAAEAQAELLRRYLHAYGPSTPERYANWLAVGVGWAAELFGSFADELEQVDLEGTPAWVSAGDAAPADGAPDGVRLLPYFDAYAYRVGNHPLALLYPGRAAERVQPGNFPTLVVDGEVVGLWQQKRSGRRLAITVEPLVRLSARQRRAVADEAERIGTIAEGTVGVTFGEVTTGSHP